MARFKVTLRRYDVVETTVEIEAKHEDQAGQLAAVFADNGDYDGQPWTLAEDRSNAGEASAKDVVEIAAAATT